MKMEKEWNWISHVNIPVLGKYADVVSESGSVRKLISSTTIYTSMEFLLWMRRLCISIR